jgi:Flp pilus assembly protein TadG
MHEEPMARVPRESPSRSRLRALCRALRDGEGGQAVVEFAILIFPLCFIVFGIIDFGRALNYYNDLTQLAGQGARAAAVNQNPNGGVADGTFQQQLAGDADSPELKNPANHIIVCINAGDMPANTGAPVTVRTSYTFNFIPLIHSASITLSAVQTERFEGVSPLYSAGCSGP